MNFFCFSGPFGDQDGEQVFVQRVVPGTNQVFVRLASNGDRSAISVLILLLELIKYHFELIVGFRRLYNDH